MSRSSVNGGVEVAVAVEATAGRSDVDAASPAHRLKSAGARAFARTGRGVGSVDIGFGWVVLVLLFAAATRVVPTLDAVRPIVFEDELGYLSNARFLAGLPAPQLGEMGFYKPGWSLLIAPIYLLTHDPAVVYRIAVTLAALLGWATAIPVAAILHRVLTMTPRRALVVATLGCMVPGSALMGGYVYAETAVTLTVALAAWCAFLVWERPTIVRSAVMGALGAYLYALHGRLIFAPLIVGSFFIVGAVTKRIGWRATAVGAVVLGSLTLAFVALDGIVESAMYDPAFDRLSRGIGGLREITPRRAAVAVLGQSWYLAATTAGLVLAGLAVLAVRAWSELTTKRMGPSVLWFLISVQVLGISALSFVRHVIDPARLDYLSYGRYIDSIAPPLVALGLAWLVADGKRASRALLRTTLVIALLAIAFFTAVGRYDAFTGAPVAALSIPGTAWAMVPGSNIHPIVAATVGAVLLGLTLWSVSRRPIALLVIWAIAASGAVVVGEYRTMRELDRPWSTRLTMQEHLDELDPDALAYDENWTMLYGRNGYQFYLPDVAFEFFDGSQELPQADLVISGRAWAEGLATGARIVALDLRVNQALWVMPSALQDELESQGRLAPAVASTALPSAARSVTVSPEGSPANGEVLSLRASSSERVTLEHSGGGAPWRPFGAFDGDVTGTVRVVSGWTCGGETTLRLQELPTLVWPGDDVEIDLALDPEWMGSAKSCEVWVDLVEEGVGMFSDAPPLAFGVARSS